MLYRMINLAKKEGVHRISAHVVADNKAVVHSYQKLGFTHEGILRDSYFGQDERYHDELVMGYVFQVPNPSGTLSFLFLHVFAFV